MPKHRFVAFVPFIVLTASVVSAADPVAGPASYMRIVDVDETTVRLDMASRTFAPADGNGPKITLVAAIHIADAAFYEKAQAHLDKHELVLFEGVGDGHDRGDDSPAAKVWTTKLGIRETAIVLERYKAGKGEYPADLATLVAAVTAQDKLKGTRVQRAAVDGWGRPLVYAKTEKSFTLISRGADGKEGGQGADSDLAFADQPAIGKGELANKGGIQSDMASALGLMFQLDGVDTGKANYRNSDLTIAQLRNRLAGKPAGPADTAPPVGQPGGGGGPANLGDDPSSKQLNQMIGLMDGSSMLSGVVKFGLSIVRASPKIQTMTKVMLMETLRVVGDDITATPSIPASMKNLLKVLIEDRNQAVIDDLKTELAKPQPAKTIAVWYGAGHLRDMETKLVTQLKYKPVDDAWLPAIKTDVAFGGMTGKDLQQIRTMLQRTLGAMKEK